MDYRPLDYRNLVNRASPYANGLVSWWMCLPHLMGGNQFPNLMGLNPGTLISMGNSNNGWRPTTRPGGWGHLLFDGTAGYVQTTAGTTLQELGAWTISAWVSCPTLTSASPQIMIGHGVSTSNARDYLMYCSTGRFSIQRSDGSNFQTLNSASSYSNSTWYHVVGTFDGTTGTIYVNGKPDISASMALSIGADAARSTTLGNIHQYDDLGFPFKGNLDDIRIYNRALSASEVQAAYLDSYTGQYAALNRVKI